MPGTGDADAPGRSSGRPVRLGLLASSSIVALLIGAAGPAAAGSCTAVSANFNNSAAITCITVTNTSFTGNVSNAGTISAGSGASTRTAVSITGSTITGSISDSGKILAPNGFGIFIDSTSEISSPTANAILIRGSTFTGGISNAGKISATNSTVRIEGATFAGGLTNSGTISGNAPIYILSTSTFAGGINNSGTLSGLGYGILLSNSSNFSGGISNSGTIASAGSGIVLALGSTFSGGITNSGTISGAGGVFIEEIKNFTGNISNSGTISVANTRAAISLYSISTFAGSIVNSSSIVGGTGIKVSNISSFAGGISNSGTISGGTGILVSNSGAISIFDSGVIIGTGGTAVSFTGTTSGNNTFTLASGYSITGNVIGTGSDIFQLGGTGSGTFNLGSFGSGQQYQGFATFNVVSGSWALTGTNTTPFSFTVADGTAIVTGTLDASSTTVNSGGVLVVDGTLSDPTINSGGVLSGTGAVGATTINAGGTLAPGPVGGIGTLTINGALTFNSGSTYAVMLTPSTSSSTAVNGAASLTGGSVNAQFASGSYVAKQYTILTTTAGLGGTTFAGVTNANMPGFTDSLSYTADDVFLNLAASLGGNTPLNPNQQSIANTINTFFNNGGTLPPGFASLFNLSGANLTKALSQLNGEGATGAERGAFDLMNEFLGLMLDPFVDGRGGSTTGGGTLGFAPDQQGGLPPDLALAYAGLLKAPPAPTFARRWSTWTSGFGGSATSNGDPTVGSNNVTTSTYGYAAGLDYHYSPDTVFGFSLAGGGTNWNLANALGTGRSDAFLAGVYGVTHNGPWYLGGALAFANNWFTTNRTALADQLTASFQGQSYAARLEGGYRFAMPLYHGAVGITPYAALQAQDFHTPAYSETDLTGGGLGLSYNAMSGTDTRSELGSRFDDLTAINNLPLILRAKVAWAHDWVSNPALNATFETLPAASFTVNGSPIPHDSALTSVGAQLFFTPSWSFLAKFDGQFASGSQLYAGSGTLRYTW